jgi:hypothetical protein
LAGVLEHLAVATPRYPEDRERQRSWWLLEQVETALRTSLGDRPVLKTFGQYNDPLPFQPRWCELFPHAEQVVIADGNHFPMNMIPMAWRWRSGRGGRTAAGPQVRGGGRSWRSVFVS